MLRRLVPPDALPPLPAALRPFVAMVGQLMLYRDPPDHTGLRTLVHKACTPAAVMRLRPRIAAIANGLVDSMLPIGGMDLIADYALPLPVTVIAEMLGVPASKREQWREWSHALAAAIDVRQSLRGYLLAISHFLEKRRFTPDMETCLPSCKSLSLCC